MEREEIIGRVREIKAETAAGNPFGEPVTLVAATKMQTPEAINAAIEAGVDAVRTKCRNSAKKIRWFNPAPVILSDTCRRTK